MAWSVAVQALAAFEPSSCTLEAPPLRLRCVAVKGGERPLVGLGRREEWIVGMLQRGPSARGCLYLLVVGEESLESPLIFRRQ